MSEKLKDPNKAAHEIINDPKGDEDAIRNDGVVLQAANKNPWYVLATIYGEQEEEARLTSHNEKLAAKNRRAWNRWYCGNPSEEERKDYAEKVGLQPEDFLPLTEEEIGALTREFRTRIKDDAAELPAPTENIVFVQVYFPVLLSFRKYHFGDGVSFSGATFASDALFDSARFDGTASFEGATFFSKLSFYSTAVGSRIFFTGARFVGDVSFRYATFDERTYFEDAVFESTAQFNSASFAGNTMFDRARFETHAPEFHMAKLYDETVFPIPEKYTDNWPPLKGAGIMPATDQKRAYNRLRLFMNKSLQIDEEQFFHRMEMRCKSVLAKWRHKPLYWLFAAFSDYGNSVWRPIAWGALSVVTAALFMLWWQGVFAFTPQSDAGFDWAFGLLKEGDVWAKPREAFGWSISNALPFLGSGKYFTGVEFAKELAWPLRVVGGVQTLFGFVLLFLFGLGLRNRFRLR